MRQRALASIVILVLLLGLGGLGLALSSDASGEGNADLYLSPEGSDDSPCSESEPCLTLQRAYNVAEPGWTVELAGGAYQTQSLAGTKEEPGVIFRPADAAAVSTGELTISADRVELRAMRITSWKTTKDASYLTCRDVSHGWFGLWSASHVSLIGGEVDGGGTVTTDPQITEEWGSGIAPEHVLIDGVSFHDWIDVDVNQANHIECLQAGAGVDVTIRNSRFRNCGTHDIFVRSWGGTGGGVHPLREWRIENNFFGATSDGYYALQFKNDLGSSGADVVIRNNSFLQTVAFDADATTDVQMIGNILSWQASWGCSADVYRHNVYEQLAGTDGPCGDTDRVAPADYVDRTALDLHLAEGSVAIDAGDPDSYPAQDVDGETRPMGDVPAAGADERE